jgi:hypothetical protein
MGWKPRSFDRGLEMSDRTERLSLTETQAYCPFVVFEPTLVPNDLSVSSISFRPEQPPSAAARIPVEVPMDGGREPLRAAGANATVRLALGPSHKLSIKQFLYDWLPPAYDYPSLWRSIRQPMGVPIGGAIGWVGENYRGQHAASVTLDRTTIEIVDGDGALSDQGLVELMLGLRPVDAAARREITRTPFGCLCYAARYTAAIPQVPLGFWQNTFAAGTRRKITVGEDALAENDMLAGMRTGEWRTSMITRIGYEIAATEIATEYILEAPGDPNATISLLYSDNRDAAGSAAPYGMAFPPQTDSQPCERETPVINGMQIYLAYTDRRYGKFEAVFAAWGKIFILMAKPRPTKDHEWFVSLLGDFLAGHSLGSTT